MGLNIESDVTTCKDCAPCALQLSIIWTAGAPHAVKPKLVVHPPSSSPPTQEESKWFPNAIQCTHHLQLL